MSPSPLVCLPSATGWLPPEELSTLQLTTASPLRRNLTPAYGASDGGRAPCKPATCASFPAARIAISCCDPPGSWKNGRGKPVLGIARQRRPRWPGAYRIPAGLRPWKNFTIGCAARRDLPACSVGSARAFNCYAENRFPDLVAGVGPVHDCGDWKALSLASGVLPTSRQRSLYGVSGRPRFADRRQLPLHPTATIAAGADGLGAAHFLRFFSRVFSLLRLRSHPVFAIDIVCLLRLGPPGARPAGGVRAGTVDALSRRRTGCYEHPAVRAGAIASAVPLGGARFADHRGPAAPGERREALGSGAARRREVPIRRRGSPVGDVPDLPFCFDDSERHGRAQPGNRLRPCEFSFRPGARLRAAPPPRDCSLFPVLLLSARDRDSLHPGLSAGGADHGQSADLRFFPSLRRQRCFDRPTLVRGVPSRSSGSDGFFRDYSVY